MIPASLRQHHYPSHGQWVVGLAAALLLGAIAEAQAPLTIASGRPDGMYWRLAWSVAQETPARGLRPVVTQGVEESLAKLERGEVRFALAQQDVVSEYFL